MAGLQADFQEHGAAVIAEVRENNPEQYLKVIAAVIPKELHVNTERLADIAMTSSWLCSLSYEPSLQRVA